MNPPRRLLAPLPFLCWFSRSPLSISLFFVLGSCFQGHFSALALLFLLLLLFPLLEMTRSM